MKDASVVRSVPNLRPIGGQPTSGGQRVRGGLLYRSGALDKLSDADAEVLGEFGIRTVFDLRSEWERRRAPDRLPPGVQLVATDVIAGMGPSGPGQLKELLVDPRRAAEVLSNGRAEAMWLDQYRDFVRIEAVRAALGCVFFELANARSRPALVHCTTGKDRTGWVVAALLWLLGVPERLVLRDYLDSQRRLEPFVEAMLAPWAEQGGDPMLIGPLMATRAEYLAAARDEVTRCFGSIEAYFDAGMGVGPGVQERLRSAFLVPD